MELGASQHLVPADPYSAELIDTRLKPGVTYKVTVVTDRTKGRLNLYWAGLGVLRENLSDEDDVRWPTVRSLHDTLMRALGYTKRQYYLDHRSADGVGWTDVPDSIALDSMDEAEFKDYCERAAAVVVARWGFDPWEIWKREHPSPNWQ